MAEAKAVAAVFTAAHEKLQIREYPILSPGAHTARLRLLWSGICGTDIHILEGRLKIPGPYIPGHEFLGHVEELGRGAACDGLGRRLRVGDIAIACVAIPCGNCFTCRQGETASCLNFGVTYLRNPDEPPHFFGGWAERLFSSTANLVKVPAAVNPQAAAAFPCAGPTAIRAFAFAGGVARGELVVVQGTGPVGLFAVAWAAKAGCAVVAIGSGSNPRRLRLAQTLGAMAVLDYRATSEDERYDFIIKLAKRMKRGNGADVVFEASGSPAAIPEGLRLVRTLGRYIVPGQYSDSGTIAIAPQQITFKAVRIIGSGQYKLRDIAAYLSFLRRHRDLQRRFAACISDCYAVADANQAWQDVSAGKTAKAVFAERP